MAMVDSTNALPAAASALPLLVAVVVVFLLSPHQFPCAAAAAARDSLLRGDSIAVENHATDFLLSPDGTFAAGFYAVSPTVFTFSVWFARAADRAVVWSATRGRPVHSNGARLTLHARRGALVLTDYDGDVVWNSTNAGAGAAAAERARLLDSGNLAVEDAVGNVLWQSFDHPTDTLLPTQRLAAGEAMVSSDKLLAGGGFYSFRFNDYSIISLVYDNHEISSVYWPNPYYSYWQNNRNIYYNSTRREAFLDESGHFLASDNATFNADDLGNGGGVRRRLKLDTDGNLRLYSLESDDLVALPHTDFWGFDINQSKLVSLHECATQCKSEPSCVAFEYKVGIGECYTKSLMFNGRTFPGLLGTAYVKVPVDLDVSDLHVHQWQKHGIAIEEDIVRCGGAVDSPELLLNVSGVSSSSSSNSIWFYFYGFLSAFFVIEVIVIAFGCWFFSSKGVFRPSQVWALDEGYKMVTNHFRAYSYSELQKGTRKFRSEIGRGGSGVVYKGILDDERVVAVKVLQDVSHSEDVFQAELSVIGRIYHMNLVRMWGFCTQGKHRILVYEYIENGSLAQVLFNRRDSSKFLGWKQRFNIALGVAKGLTYLHNECLEGIIHCDMKSENILLDEDMEPKITDFGLSKLLDRDGYGSQMSRIRGTRGYMAPEWVSSLPITEKVDVYSYGVVLLELVKGRRISDWVVNGKEGIETDMRSAVKMVVDKLESNNKAWIMDMMDDQLDGEFNHLQAKLLIQLAVSCLEEDRNKRPSMKYIVQMLISAEE
uniref:Receptor-like serine/threonine-protein kinase n=1 Tax=Leersia perrieri TaxID=77586 RepID=A0A0D9XNR9_9ORYZ